LKPDTVSGLLFRYGLSHWRRLDAILMWCSSIYNVLCLSQLMQPFQLRWLQSYSYKLISMLSVCMSVCECGC